MRPPSPTPAALPAVSPELLQQPEAPDFKSRMEQFEVQLLLDALERTNGNRTKAAELLNMPIRTLSHKLNQHGIKKGYGVK
jgi:DNA-binding NtrC family response regulator